MTSNPLALIGVQDDSNLLVMFKVSELETEPKKNPQKKTPDPILEQKLK